MIAIGAGGLDVAVAIGGGAYNLTCPRVTKVNLEGDLPDWVSAKDVVLKILSQLTTKGNVNTVLEYGGDGAKKLTVPERATITNMGAETGVTTSIFPSDEQTAKFLAAQGRSDHWKPLSADDDAEYDSSIDIDLSELEPLAAAPHSPGNVVPVRDLDIAVDQVMIGSCTNSSYVDLMTVAEMVKGRTLPPHVSFGIAPGSRQVLRMIARNGALDQLLSFGARILESACGFCIGNSMSPPSASASIRTSNRNFEGRSGTKDAKVYLTSPAVAAAAAISGRLFDPRDLEIPYPRVEMPYQFEIDDSMIIAPLSPVERSKVRIIRGPNIGELPRNTPMPNDINGVVTIKVGNYVTTDHIMPAGSRLKYRSNVPKYAQFVFEPIDEEFPDRATKIRDKGLHNVIVAGLSYGQGSSREHAALCPMYLGVRAVVARSIERIHAANLINFGIIPFALASDQEYDSISQGLNLTIPRIRQALEKGESLIPAFFDGSKIDLRLELSGRQRAILLAGGLLPYTVEKR